jgi:hypothetical protein
VIVVGCLVQNANEEEEVWFKMRTKKKFGAKCERGRRRRSLVQNANEEEEEEQVWCKMRGRVAR